MAVSGFEVVLWISVKGYWLSRERVYFLSFSLGGGGLRAGL
jgi:hypothetical protein